MKFSRSRRPSHSIDMAPLIDVVFLLLIFFMLTSNFVPPSLPMQLPRASGGEPAISPAVVVSLDAEGQLSIDGEICERSGFVLELTKALAFKETSTVHFRGDREVAYGEFVDLIDRARGVGVGQFHLIHEVREESGE